MMRLREHRMLICLLLFVLNGYLIPVMSGVIPAWKRAAFYMVNETVCIIDKTVYKDGEPIPTDDPCESCKCRPPGFACLLRDCISKPGCKAVRREGECCPDYICGCEYNGKVYSDGDIIRDDQNPCYTCKCNGSSIFCTFADCFFRVDCMPMYHLGECCPRYDHCPPLTSSSKPFSSFTTKEPDVASTLSTLSENTLNKISFTPNDVTRETVKDPFKDADFTQDKNIIITTPRPTTSQSNEHDFSTEKMFSDTERFVPAFDFTSRESTDTPPAQPSFSLPLKDQDESINIIPTAQALIQEGYETSKEDLDPLREDRTTPSSFMQNDNRISEKEILTLSTEMQEDLKDSSQFDKDFMVTSVAKIDMRDKFPDKLESEEFAKVTNRIIVKDPLDYKTRLPERQTTKWPMFESDERSKTVTLPNTLTTKSILKDFQENYDSNVLGFNENDSVEDYINSFSGTSTFNTVDPLDIKQNQDFVESKVESSDAANRVRTPIGPSNATSPSGSSNSTATTVKDATTVESGKNGSNTNGTTTTPHDKLNGTNNATDSKNNSSADPTGHSGNTTASPLGSAHPNNNMTDSSKSPSNNSSIGSTLPQNTSASGGLTTAGVTSPKANDSHQGIIANGTANSTTPHPSSSGTSPNVSHPMNDSNTLSPAHGSETSHSLNDSKTPSSSNGSETPHPLNDSKSTSPPHGSETPHPLNDSKSTSPLHGSEIPHPLNDSNTTSPPHGSETPHPLNDSKSTSPLHGSEIPHPLNDSNTTSPPHGSEIPHPLNDSNTTSPPHGSETPHPLNDSKTPSSAHGSETPAQPHGSETPNQMHDSQTTTPLDGSQAPNSTHSSETPSQMHGSQTPVPTHGSETPTQAGSHAPSQINGSQTPSQTHDSQPPSPTHGSEPPTQAGSQTPSQMNGSQPPSPTHDSEAPAQAGSHAPSQINGSQTPSQTHGSQPPSPTHGSEAPTQVGSQTPSQTNGLQTPSPIHGSETPNHTHSSMPSGFPNATNDHSSGNSAPPYSTPPDGHETLSTSDKFRDGSSILKPVPNSTNTTVQKPTDSTGSPTNQNDSHPTNNLSSTTLGSVSEHTTPLIYAQTETPFDDHKTVQPSQHDTDKSAPSTLSQSPQTNSLLPMTNGSVHPTLSDNIPGHNSATNVTNNLQPTITTPAPNAVTSGSPLLGSLNDQSQTSADGSRPETTNPVNNDRHNSETKPQGMPVTPAPNEPSHDYYSTKPVDSNIATIPPQQRTNGNLSTVSGNVPSDGNHFQERTIPVQEEGSTIPPTTLNGLPESNPNKFGTNYPQVNNTDPKVTGIPNTNASYGGQNPNNANSGSNNSMFPTENSPNSVFKTTEKPPEVSSIWTQPNFVYGKSNEPVQNTPFITQKADQTMVSTVGTLTNATLQSNSEERSTQMPAVATPAFPDLGSANRPKEDNFNGFPSTKPPLFPVTKDAGQTQTSQTQFPSFELSDFKTVKDGTTQFPINFPGTPDGKFLYDTGKKPDDVNKFSDSKSKDIDSGIKEIRDGLIPPSKDISDPIEKIKSSIEKGFDTNNQGPPQSKREVSFSSESSERSFYGEQGKQESGQAEKVEDPQKRQQSKDEFPYDVNPTENDKLPIVPL